jgi:hypothetical protein
MKGGCISGALFTSILLSRMNIPIMKAPPPPIEPVSGEEEETNDLEESKASAGLLRVR